MKKLLKMVKDQFNRPVKLTIFSHWHQDRIGGIDTLIAEHIETSGTAATAQLAVKAGFQKPQTAINSKV
jgi:metallo-beta-lactamase class B